MSCILLRGVVACGGSACVRRGTGRVGKLSWGPRPLWCVVSRALGGGGERPAAFGALAHTPNFLFPPFLASRRHQCRQPPRHHPFSSLPRVQGCFPTGGGGLTFSFGSPRWWLLGKKTWCSSSNNRPTHHAHAPSYTPTHPPTRTRTGAAPGGGSTNGARGFAQARVLVGVSCVRNRQVSSGIVFPFPLAPPPPAWGDTQWGLTG